MQIRYDVDNVSAEQGGGRERVETSLAGRAFRDAKARAKQST